MKLLCITAALFLATSQGLEKKAESDPVPITTTELTDAIAPYKKEKLVYNTCGYVWPGTKTVVLAGKATADTILRERAEDEAKEIGVVKNGEMVRVFGIKDGWVEVAKDKVRGWTEEAHVACIQDLGPNKDTDRKDLGLACSSFATAVLANVRGVKLDTLLHTKYGDQIAAYHKLTAKITVEVASLLKEKGPKEKQFAVDDGVYFFDARRVRAGHVGFLVIVSKRISKQFHFTSLNADGLCVESGFWEWIEASIYKNGNLTLYLVTKPNPAKPAENSK